MDEVTAREILSMFKDMLRLMEAGKPIPVDFLKRQMAEWEGKIKPDPKKEELTKLHSCL